MHTSRRPHLLLSVLAVLALMLGLTPAVAPRAAAADPAVTLVGSLQSELGCSGDWEPACAATALTPSGAPGVWQASFAVPAGSWEYKVALDGGWTVNYGLHATLGGANILLNLAEPTTVTFYYSAATHWITDDTTPLVTAPGSHQSELGCTGDWQPKCLVTWLQDPDGDGTYTFETTALPVGTYEAKAALGLSWDENYGAGGALNGPNIPFTVASAGQTVRFSYVAATHVLTITVTGGAAAHDNNLWWDGIRHDSRDPLYRTPSGAVPAGTPVTLRLRTFHGDATGVSLRLYSLDGGGAALLPMTPAAQDVSCYDPTTALTCDFWEYTVPGTHAPDNLWYRFVVTDGTATAYHADDTPALDGGPGRTTDTPVDQSWALMLSVPGFTAPAWAKDAVVYQIFPDRFRNGRSNNDPDTGDVRYDDPVLELGCGTLPEGYCRNYAGATPQTCPWRFGKPADATTDIEQPRGRDYYGGDLKGVDQQLDYLKTLGINTLYFNPIFDAGSNHAYDTQDYKRVDPAFGTSKDFDNLVKHAGQLGIRIVLDGVFNHLSSDSPFFDRYGHYDTLGACESTTSPYRDWFTFTAKAGGPCAGPGGANTMTYEAWFGFDSIPVLTKSDADVQAYFLTAPDAVAKLWLKAGASGWRLDVSGDASFPAGYWETFRTATKATKADSLSISETWQKDSTLLRMIRGDRLDTTMNYRLRDAVLGLLAPQQFDSKGFADSGRQLAPSEFAARLASVREDYPDAAYYSLMNLLDSHDTERLLWTLTDGADGAVRNTPGADDKQRLRLAALIQFTQAGMPTVFYGDEVGITGDDDPDDRRTYPWLDKGGNPDLALYAYYQGLARARKADPALTTGDFRVLLADDAARTVAYGRKTATHGSVVALNVSDAARTLSIPVAGYLPDGTRLTVRYGAGVAPGATATVSGGSLQIALPAMTGALLSTGATDLAGPAAPSLQLTAEASGSVLVAWTPTPGAVAYHVYTSPVSGGGWVRATTDPVTTTTFTVTGLANAVPVHVVVRAVDAAGNEGAASNEVVAVPHLSIGWANLQWPPTMAWTISATTRTDTLYGQVWIDGATNPPGATPTLRAQAGFGPTGTAPTAASWTWVDATFNTQAGNNDEFQASFQPQAVGTYDYVFRYSTTGGRDWTYADLSGPLAAPDQPAANPGVLTVNSSGDTTAPTTPTGLRVTAFGPTGLSLAWDAVAGDASLYGYEVGRRPAGSTNAYAVLASVTTTSYSDATVTSGASYEYAVRSVDTSFNRSGWSSPVTATAQLRTVSVTFTVTVPATTDATGKSVNIAGSLNRLDPPGAEWNPGATPLTRVDATHWRITLTGLEGTQIEYKYALGSWDYVEKDNACGEIGNRQLNLSYGTDGVQTVDDTVLNWRNVAPCGS